MGIFFFFLALSSDLFQSPFNVTPWHTATLVGHSIPFKFPYSDFINVLLPKSSGIGSILKTDLYMNHLCDRETTYYMYIMEHEQTIKHLPIPRSKVKLT